MVIIYFLMNDEKKFFSNIKVSEEVTPASVVLVVYMLRSKWGSRALCTVPISFGQSNNYLL